MVVEAEAPTRVDLAGGTLDIWPIFLMLDEAVTVNLAIDLPARARVAPARGRGVVLRSLDHGTAERFPSRAAALAGARHGLAAEARRGTPGGPPRSPSRSAPPWRAGSGTGRRSPPWRATSRAG